MALAYLSLCNASTITRDKLEYFDATVNLISHVGSTVDRKTESVPIDPSTLLIDPNTHLQTLITIFGEPYPINHRLTSPFASAQTPGGVGASGIVFGKGSLSATVLIDEHVRNVGSEALQLGYHYSISPINVSILSGDGIFSQQAHVDMFTEIQHNFADGSFHKERIYDYSLTVSKPRANGGTAAFDIERSAQLQQDAGPETILNGGGPFGVHYDAFDGFRDLGVLASGDTLFLTFGAIADVDTNTPEVGLQALIGDPFDLSGGFGRFTIAPTGQAPVVTPEPSSLMLVFLGAVLAMGGVALRRWRRSADFLPRGENRGA
jgi:hypothetical protein